MAWFHCYAGIAGDMALGSLIDAGADVDEVRGLLERLALPGWQLGVRGGHAGRYRLHPRPRQRRRRGRPHLRAIVALIEEAALPARVARRALDVFRSLASVESALHRRPIDQVHFHEVGGHDAVIDIVGTAAALEVLGVDEVRASAGRHRHAARCAARTAACPTRPRRRCACSKASRPTAVTSPSSSRRRPVPPCWRRCARRSGRCRT